MGKFTYRYEITETFGEPVGVEVGSVIQDHRYQGKSHEWLIYDLTTMEFRSSFKGRLIERVTTPRGNSGT